MENILQRLQNLTTGIVIMGSAMAFSLVHMEYGMYIAIMIVLLGLFGIISWIKGKKVVSTSVGWASLLAVLPAWFSSANLGVTLFVIFLLAILLILYKKNPDNKGENFLHALLLAGMLSSLVSLYRIITAFLQMKYFSQINVVYNSVYALAPLLVFLICFLVANHKEKERLERERLEARTAARELVREFIKEQRAKEEFRLNRESAGARSEGIRVEELSEEGTVDESSLQSADLMEQAMQEEYKPLSFTQGITVLFGEDIIEDMWENGAELAEKPQEAFGIAAESTADRIEFVGETAAVAAGAAEENPKEIEEEGAVQLREIIEKPEAEIVAGNEMESWKELFRQGDGEEAIEEVALDALSEEDVTDLPEAEEFAKTVSQEEGQVSRFGHEELELMLAEYQENEMQTTQEEPSTVDNVTPQEPLPIGREDFCIKQEEYFRTQYELIIQQAEIFRKRKEYHQSLLDESNAQFDFYTKQADIYLQQIDFYRKQREN